MTSQTNLFIRSHSPRDIKYECNTTTEETTMKNETQVKIDTFFYALTKLTEYAFNTSLCVLFVYALAKGVGIIG